MRIQSKSPWCLLMLILLSEICSELSDITATSWPQILNPRDTTPLFVVCILCGRWTNMTHGQMTMARISMLMCRSVCQTLVFWLACNVVPYPCTSSSTVNHANSIQLLALQCTSRYRDTIIRGTLCRGQLSCTVIYWVYQRTVVLKKMKKVESGEKNPWMEKFSSKF